MFNHLKLKLFIISFFAVLNAISYIFPNLVSAQTCGSQLVIAQLSGCDFTWDVTGGTCNPVYTSNQTLYCNSYSATQCTTIGGACGTSDAGKCTSHNGQGASACPSTILQSTCSAKSCWVTGPTAPPGSTQAPTDPPDNCNGNDYVTIQVRAEEGAITANNSGNACTNKLFGNLNGGGTGCSIFWNCAGNYATLITCGTSKSCAISAENLDSRYSGCYSGNAGATATWSGNDCNLASKNYNNNDTVYIYPTKCTTPAAPTNLVPRTGSPPNCMSAAGNLTFSWNAVSGATGYDIRIDNTANGWNGSCSSPNAGDTCIDNHGSTSYTRSVTPGNNYNWWVHGRNSCGTVGAAASSGTFQVPTCTSAPTGTFSAGGGNVYVNSSTTFNASTSNSNKAQLWYRLGTSGGWTQLGADANGTNASISRSFGCTSGMVNNTYQVVLNAYNASGGQCSGNPSLPSGWTSCSADDLRTVTCIPVATNTPVPGVCTGTFNNSTMWDAEESTGLSANLGKTHSTTDTGTKCQFYCNTGYTWNGSSCAAAPPANCAAPSGLTQSTDCSGATNKIISLNWNDNVTGCTQFEIDKNTVNTFPNNANANDFTGVSNFLYGTGWPKTSDHYFRVRCSQSSSCTVGNFWSSSVLSTTCPVTQYNCTGTTPTNAALWDAEESTGLTANLGKTYSATDTGTKCQYRCNTGYAWNAASSTCTVITYNCTGTFTNSTMWDAEESTGLTANLGKTHSTTDTGTKCQFYCNTGYTWNGSSCAVNQYNCTGTFNNSTMWDAEESTGLTANLGKTHSTTDTGTKCQFYCNTGYTWNGSSCAVNQYNCTGTTPANAAMWDAEESTGLTANLGKTHSTTDTGTKCQYHCNTNYTWNAASSTCVANTFSCTGTTPANAAMWDAEESTGLTANLGKTHSTTDTGTKCQYHCDAGYSWNAASSTCVANTFNCTGSFPNAAMWDAEESTGLTANTARSYAASDTAIKCQYRCDAGYTWNGTTCAISYSCTGTTPANAAMWDAEEGNGLTADLGKTHSATDTAIKCQFHCDAGYTWNAATNSCGIVYTCTGPTPANASLWDNEERNGLTVDTPKSYGATDDAAIKCQFHCDAGYTWDAATSSCAIVYNCTGPIPSNASMWDAEESDNLTADTARTHSATDTAVKCQYHCDAGYIWDGNSCEVSYNISGSVFNDRNLNRIKDNSEPNYTGNINIQSTRGNVTINNGTFQVRGILAGQLTVSYTSNLPAGFEMVYPLNGPPPAFQVTVGPGCTVLDPATGASCNASNDIINLNFAITDSIPWIQSRGGDMRIDRGFTNFVAGNPTCTGSFASVPNPPSLNPGILFTGDGRAEFGKGDSSQKGWVVGGTNYPEVFKTTSSRLPSSFASILASVNRAGITIKNLTSVCSNLNNCTLPSNLPIGAYRANNDVTLNGYNFPNNNNYIFLINGTLTLNGNITVPDTSTAFFSASDNIVVNSNVGSTPSCSAASNLEGFYSADNDVTIQGINDCTVSADNMLTIEGSVFVNAEINGGRFINNRNLCGNNYNFPSISFIERPDFILNIPGLLKRKGFIFSEEAP